MFHQGFCVTAGAYNHFINYAELDEVIRELINGLDEEDSSMLQRVSKAIQDRINDGDIPEDLKRNHKSI